MDRRQKALLKRAMAVFVPLVVFLTASIVGADVYLAHRMVNPERRAVINTPQGYEQILQKPIWDEKTWPGGGSTTMSGWLIYQDQPAPTVILSHAFGSNREELLSTSFRLWDQGYNVIAYDLRGHGNSSTVRSSLGLGELDDLRATIAYAKELKNEAGVGLSDGRIGLYGIDMGGFISLTAAADDPAIKAIAVDTIYPSQDEWYRYLTKAQIGSTGPPGSSLVEVGAFQSLLATTLGFYGVKGSQPLTASEAFSRIGDRPSLIITSKLSPLGAYSRTAAAMAPNAKVLELDRTRSGSSLIKQDAMVYDDAIVSFFTQATDFVPPSRPKYARPGEAAKAAAGGKPAAHGSASPAPASK
ncbi:MAG: alpha/beta fold hydrolase [Blastocatellia bacterium]